MRTILRLVRSLKTTRGQASQIQVDLSLFCDIIGENMPKDEESNLSGFYFECINSLGRGINSREGDSWKIAEGLLVAMCKGKRQNLGYIYNGA